MRAILGFGDAEIYLGGPSNAIDDREDPALSRAVPCRSTFRAFLGKCGALYDVIYCLRDIGGVITNAFNVL